MRRRISKRAHDRILRHRMEIENRNKPSEEVHSGVRRFRSNLQAPDLEPAFKHAKEIPNGNSGHTVLCDPDFSISCGYMTHDEAAILYNLALVKKGKWLEIGSHTGWSACHVLASGSTVDLVDPEYSETANLPFVERTLENISNAGGDDFRSRSKLYGELSDDFFAHNTQKYDGIIIDGNHDFPCPKRDAINADKCLEPNGIIVFHDYVGGPIKEGVDYLISQGYRLRLYFTPQIIAVCWKGDFIPPVHVPDSRCVRKEMDDGGSIGPFQDGITKYWSSSDPFITIMILTLPKRIGMLRRLLNVLDAQRQPGVEILINSDNKQYSIGMKRQQAVDAATGKYVAFIDDDDLVSNDYVLSMLETAKNANGVDVLTFNQRAVMSGSNPFTVSFSIHNDHNQELKHRRGRYDDITRRPFHMCFWKAEIAKRHKFIDANWGEDWKWCESMLTEARTEKKVLKTLHYYTYDANVSECGG